MTRLIARKTPDHGQGLTSLGSAGQPPATERGRCSWPPRGHMTAQRIAAWSRRVGAVLGLLWLCACEQEVAPPPVIAQVPPFALRDQRGAEVTAQSLRGQVWVANFIFTSCPDVCPLLTKKMADLRLGIVRRGAKVHFVSFSIDPETDTPEVLRAYAEKRGAAHDDWLFLTGSIDAIKRVVVAGFKQTVEPDPERPDNILHGSHFVLVDREGAIRGFFRSDPDGLLALSQAARQLAQEP